MKLLLTLLLSTLSLLAIGQNPWTQVSESEVISKHALDRLTVPTTYDTYQLDVEVMRKSLAKAPLMDYNLAPNKAKMALPLANGTTEIFEFVESPAMSPVLAAKFPNIKSYKGKSIESPGTSAWIDYSPEGFRAAINTIDGTIYIDPFFDAPTGDYIVYDVRNDRVDTAEMPHTCGVQAYEDNIDEQNRLEGNPYAKRIQRGQGLPVVKHTYRFALACTGQWGTQQGGTVAAVMAKMNTATNRLNSFFEPELAMKLELVDNNDKLIFFNSTEPYTNAELGREVLQENTQIISNNIGFNSFDMGHVFTVRCIDGIAGVANLGSVCNQTKGYI